MAVVNVRVIQTNTRTGFERDMVVTQKVWDKLVKKPNLVAGMKWRLWTAPKKATTRFVEVPIDAEVQILEKKAEITQESVTQYEQKDYKSDLVLGKKSAIEGDKETAIAAFKRALEFKPKNPYIKSQLKKLSE